MQVVLKLAFVARGRSQREIAAETRISDSRLSQIVNGWVEPRPDEQTALAKTLDVPRGVLFAPGPVQMRALLEVLDRVGADSRTRSEIAAAVIAQGVADGSSEISLPRRTR